MSAVRWTYKGEAGGALGAAERDFDVIAPRIRFASLGMDELTYTVMLASMIPTDEPIPEEEEQITVYRDGIRFFTGQVSSVRRSGYVVTVTVSGPWWDMEHNPLSTPVTTSGGAASVRVSYAFASGASMSTSWGALIDRAIAIGVPMTKGTLATTFNYLPVTLNQMSCAGALAELVRLIPDAVAWFDYTVAAAPALNISRRRQLLATGSAEVIELDARDFDPSSWELDSVPQFRISQVRVPYLDRGADGLRRYQEQASGIAEAGHVQIYTASGEELDTFLPNDSQPSYSIQTVAPSGTPLKDWVVKRDPNIAAAADLAGLAPTALPLVAGPATLAYQTSSPALPATNITETILATRFLAADGSTVSIAGKQLILTDNPPDWLSDLHTVEVVTVTGQIYYEFKESDYSGGVLTTTYALPTWWFGVQWDDTRGGGFRGPNSSTFSGYELFIHNFEIEGYLINTTYAAPTTVYDPPDYNFIAPPAGFAAGLLGCQNWTPYAGRIGWQEEECGSRRYLGRVVNVTNAGPAYESMLAIVVGEDLDLDTGVTTLTLGSPARLNFLSVIDKQRTHSAQQIVYL